MEGQEPGEAKTSAADWTLSQTLGKRGISKRTSDLFCLRIAATGDLIVNLLLLMDDG
jgi:hypothetical protein